MSKVSNCPPKNEPIYLSASCRKTQRERKRERERSSISYNTYIQSSRLLSHSPTRSLTHLQTPVPNRFSITTLLACLLTCFVLHETEKLIKTRFSIRLEPRKTDPCTNERNPCTRIQTNHLDSAHGALVHGVGRDLAALREEDAGGLRGGAVGDGVEVACADSDWDN